MVNAKPAITQRQKAKPKRKLKIKQEPVDIEWPNSDVVIDITGNDSDNEEPFLNLSGLEQEVQKEIFLNILLLILVSV